MFLLSCGFVVLGWVCLILYSYVPLSNILFTSLGEEISGPYASRACVYLFLCLTFLSLSSSSWCHGLAAACDCDMPWTFHLNSFEYKKKKKETNMCYLQANSTCFEEAEQYFEYVSV